MADYERLPLLITKKEVSWRGTGLDRAKVPQQEDCFGIMFQVLDWNEMAIQFYKKMDATFLDDWKTVLPEGRCPCGLSPVLRARAKILLLSVWSGKR